MTGMIGIGGDRRASGILGKREVKRKKTNMEDTEREGISVRPYPTSKELFLYNMDIESLLTFDDTYAVIQQDWKHALKIGQYMHRNVRSAIERKCVSIPKYSSILAGRTLLHQGTQLLTNTQIWKVIRKIIEPKSSREVQKFLKVSVYPAGKYDEYKDKARSMKNFSDFKNQAMTFDRSWLNMIAMITTSKSRKFFPQMMNVAGKDDNVDRGLMQYYLGILLFECFDDCKDRQRGQEDFAALTEEVSSNKSEPPKATKYMAEKRTRFKARVHQMDTEDTLSDDNV